MKQWYALYVFLYSYDYIKFPDDIYIPDMSMGNECITNLRSVHYSVYGMYLCITMYVASVWNDTVCMESFTITVPRQDCCRRGCQISRDMIILAPYLDVSRLQKICWKIYSMLVNRGHRNCVDQSYLKISSQ